MARDDPQDGAGKAAPFHLLPGDPAPPAAWWLRAEDGIRLRAGLWQPAGAARGTVLLFQGRTEYLEKYGPFARRLTGAGLAVIGVDWRGQGLSDRLLADPRLGHVADFAEYQRDVVELAVAAQAMDLPRPWHLLAHSMGGCIGLAALMNGLPVDSAAFSAPMWGLHHPRVPGAVVTGLIRTADRLGHTQRAAIGTGGAGTYLLDAPFRGNALTGDARQWGRLVAQAGTWPDLTLGGATYAWIAAARAEMQRLARLPSPAVATLIGVGGAEAVVSQAAIRNRAAGWPQARLLQIADARHELLFESEALAHPFTDAMVALFTA